MGKVGTGQRNCGRGLALKQYQKFSRNNGLQIHCFGFSRSPGMDVIQTVYAPLLSPMLIQCGLGHTILRFFLHYLMLSKTGL